MKFFEMKKGKEYRMIFNDGSLNTNKCRINNLGDVELGVVNWHKIEASHLDLYSINFEEIKREIDWDKVPRLTPVRVKICKEEEWEERKFLIKGSDIDYPYICLTKGDKNSTNWRYCEIIGEVKEEWYK